MVGRDFQKSLQPFVAYRFSVFEDNVCLPIRCPGWEPNYADITFKSSLSGLA